MNIERARVERAKEILNEQPAEFPMREYFEALANESLQQYYLDRFKVFQLYSDLLPGEKLVGLWHPDYPMMKCRGTCVTGIGFDLKLAISDKVIKSKEIIEKADFFRNYNWNFQKGKKGEYWTTPEEIVLINNTLDPVAEYLNGEYTLKDNGDLLKTKFQEILIEARKYSNI